MKVFSKSLFKLGLECLNKLYFTNKKKYANQKNEDFFLEALAQGDFKIKELARMHYSDGVFIASEQCKNEKAVELTNQALKYDDNVLFGAAL